ncbi:MAG: metallo-hydrolase family protein [Balneolaceae bacterium]|nr:metallo-hydrolase family protein [Balneolaceae bacterium]
MKRFLFCLSVCTTLIVITGTTSHLNLVSSPKQIAEFIKNNPEKASLHLVVDDSVLVNYNADRMMPLASTVKIIIAVEFAEQAAAGTIDPGERVSLSELRRFYIPNTDGGTHPAWLNMITKQGLVNNGQVTLHDVAKGMIWFSSNANTEFLLMKLGIENVNNRLDSLDIKNHEPIYPFISSLYLFNDETIDASELSLNEYRKKSTDVFYTLQSDTSMKNEFSLSSLTMDAQKIWSEHLPASTASTYTSVMDKINSRSYFSEKVHATLNPIMEVVMTNPANQEWLEHSGMKGGSTAFVLTKALYATTKSGTDIEMAYFLDNLSSVENMSIKQSMNSFELEVLSNSSFREKLSTMLEGK